MQSAASARLEAVFVGRPVPFGPNGEPSAIQKCAVTRPIEVRPQGLAGDEQGDKRRHGGLDKAVHHYPAEHYPFWRAQLPDVATRHWYPGAFGENLSTTGLTESDICIGDVFQVGNVRLQVSQARQPCWKLNLRFETPDMAKRVQDSGRTGWYYRVLEPGRIAPDDLWVLTDRPHADWTLARILRCFYRDTQELDALQSLAALKVLPPSWQNLIEQRLRSGVVEDWRRRLETPCKT